MPTALGNTARILRNLRLHAYKRTLIAFFLVEIVITFLFTVTVSGRNGLHSSPNLPPSPSDVHQNHRYSATTSPNSSTEPPPVTPDGLFPLSFFSESVSILNLPLNLVGMVLVSTEAVYFTLLYFPLRYFFTVALFRLVAAAPFAYCYPLMIDLLLVVVLHFYYVRLYNVKFFGRRSRGDGDDQEFVIEEEETDGDSIFSVENHLHAAQLNAPPPSYTEVTRNPLKYPSLVGVVEVGNSGGNASSSSAVLQLSPRRLESIEEVGEEAAAASAAAAAAAVEGQMTSTTLTSTTAATTTTRT